VRPGDVAASIPHLLGPCFVFAVAWLSFGTARNMRDVARLREIAFEDALTGLANRRALDARLEQEIERAGTGAAPLCVLILDIDFFKRVNDQHGHEGGDVVLRTLAVLIGRAAPERCLAGRLGGEEFMIVMPGVPAREAVALAERLRAAWAETTVLLPGGGAVRSTVSFGIAAAQPGETAAALARRADMALYAAKRAGRDRVSMAA
jgi:two-component system, cell cycle response regulator